MNTGFILGPVSRPLLHPTGCVTSLTSNQLAFLDPFSLGCNTVRIVSQVQKDNIILAEYTVAGVQTGKSNKEIWFVLRVSEKL